MQTQSSFLSFPVDAEVTGKFQSKHSVKTKVVDTCPCMRFLYAKDLELPTPTQKDLENIMQGRSCKRLYVAGVVDDSFVYRIGWGPDWVFVVSLLLV